MFPDGFISQARIRVHSPAASKKRVLEELAQLLAPAEDQANDIFDHLLERERLGSTGFGSGVALPHARLAGLSEARGAFVQLGQAIEFDAMDGKGVDLLFALLVPEQATEEHLQLLSGLARLFADPETCTSLRAAASAADALYTITQADQAHESAGHRTGSVQQSA